MCARVVASTGETDSDLIQPQTNSGLNQETLSWKQAGFSWVEERQPDPTEREGEEGKEGGRESIESVEKVDSFLLF